MRTTRFELMQLDLQARALPIELRSLDAAGGSRTLNPLRATRFELVMYSSSNHNGLYCFLRYCFHDLNGIP